jgi:hypothetical protein
MATPDKEIADADIGKRWSPDFGQEAKLGST